MNRRAMLLLCLSGALRADAADEVWDVLAKMAGTLSDGDAAGFLTAIDPALPGYEQLRLNIIAITRFADAQIAIDAVENQGDTSARTVVSDWLLLLKQKDSVSAAVRRRQRLTCKLEKRRKKWLVVSLDPQSLFDAPHF